METISVIIVSFNTKDLLSRCLKSVLASKIGQKTLEIFVVDNASEDGSAEMVQQDFPLIHLIANTDNVGFGKANNQAFTKATGDYLFLLNPDTEIGSDTIEKFWQFCQIHKNIGLVAPRLQFADGTLQPSCYNLPTIRRAISEFFFGHIGAYTKFAPKVQTPIQVEVVAGAAMFLPQATTVAVNGLFDEKFYFYYEDLDLCRRIGKTGRPIYYDPTITITHYHGASTKKRGSWAYEQNQKSAKIYFGSVRYFIITAILRYGQKWQRLLRMIKHTS